MAEKYVALVNVDGQTFWIANGDNNNPRIFDDEELAKSVANVISSQCKIMTLEEFEKQIGK